MDTKTLYGIGPRGGLTKLGECPVNCDETTVLGREADKHDNLVWGYGRTEKERRAEAYENAGYKAINPVINNSIF